MHLKEDKGIINQYVFLILCYPKISVKALAHHLFLPIPIVSAIKNELKKKNMITDQTGIIATLRGERIIRQELKIEHLDIKRYLQVISMPNCADLFVDIKTIYEHRPTADVTIDQSKCTMETAFKRASYLLEKQASISGSLLCVGDDDLVSVACCLLYNYITHAKGTNFQVTVVDKDQRILDYITQLSIHHQLPITCITHDLVHPMPKDLLQQFDCTITDPPYTLNGLQLFMTRGLSCLKHDQEVPLFLSYPHKPLDERLKLQQFLTTHQIVINQLLSHFNHYEGAQIIGGVSDFYYLKVNINSKFIANEVFTEKIYTKQQRENST